MLSLCDIQIIRDALCNRFSASEPYIQLGAGGRPRGGPDPMGQPLPVQGQAMHQGVLRLGGHTGVAVGAQG